MVHTDGLWAGRDVVLRFGEDDPMIGFCLCGGNDGVNN